ncbi:hypothetical protein, partial [Agrobacterium sp.]|uniref:hypothetical protein n=1 Tax=Agrobacterium sp. TaxID=361 RepID=UPI0028981B9F
MIPPLPETDRRKDESAILSDNYSQVVTGVESCQARVGKIDSAKGSEKFLPVEISPCGYRRFYFAGK